MQASFRWHAKHWKPGHRSTLASRCSSPAAPKWRKDPKQVFDKGAKRDARGPTNTHTETQTNLPKEVDVCLDVCMHAGNHVYM